MTQSETLNLTSLNLVRDELVATIEESATKLEQFVTDCNNEEALQAAIDGIKQISGTLSLIQLRGADLLAEELLQLIQVIVQAENNDSEEQLSVLTNSFFLLPRYIEYSQQTRRAMPALLIPHINQVRQVRKAPVMPESFFFAADSGAERSNPSKARGLTGADLEALIRRLRHMYQVGLLNVIKGKQVKPALAMMQRALERLDIISGGRASNKLWWLGATALQAMGSQAMAMTKHRKLLLGVVDRQLKLLQTGGEKEFDRKPSNALLKELLYLIMLSGLDNERVTSVKETFSLEPLGYTDAELRRESEAMKGPSASTMSSMAAVLKDELRFTKDMLERASLGGVDSASAYDELTVTLQKIADILAVVGLAAASHTLKQEIGKIESWRKQGEMAGSSDLQELADVMLYVESSVSDLERQNLSESGIGKVNVVDREEVISRNQLAEAEFVVLEEGEAGLALVKRALNSFSESNYDQGHIKNVPPTLNAIRGGLVMLNLARGGAVVAACIAFVKGSLMQNEPPAALQHLLETFADALISLEYYLEEVKGDRDCDDRVLELAEESLQALGYPVIR